MANYKRKPEMTTEEKAIYKYVLDKDVVTFSSIEREFKIPPEKIIEILDSLVKRNFIKSDLITNMNNRVRVRLYKSPISDELDRTDFVSSNL